MDSIAWNNCMVLAKQILLYTTFILHSVDNLCLFFQLPLLTGNFHTTLHRTDFYFCFLAFLVQLQSSANPSLPLSILSTPTQAVTHACSFTKEASILISPAPSLLPWTSSYTAAANIPLEKNKTQGCATHFQFCHSQVEGRMFLSSRPS